MWQPGWEGRLGENGHVCMSGWVPSLFTWDHQHCLLIHDILVQNKKSRKRKAPCLPQSFFALSQAACLPLCSPAGTSSALWRCSVQFPEGMSMHRTRLIEQIYRRYGWANFCVYACRKMLLLTFGRWSLPLRPISFSSSGCTWSLFVEVPGLSLVVARGLSCPRHVGS